MKVQMSVQGDINPGARSRNPGARSRTPGARSAPPVRAAATPVRSGLLDQVFLRTTWIVTSPASLQRHDSRTLVM